MPSARLHVDPQLWFLLRCDRRRPDLEVAVTATDTAGHVVQMVGIPLTEVDGLRVDGHEVAPSARPLWGGESGGHGVGEPAPAPLVEVVPRRGPQAAPTSPPRFLLDVHLGSLTRRLRLLGLDAAYEVDAADGHLVDRALGEARVLLSRDRGLLSRSALTDGALVRASRTQDQLEEVLRRFAPPLAPWTRCVRCNGTIVSASVDDVAEELEAGTRRSYQDFARCTGCGRVYWRGAHSTPLEAVVRHAEELVADLAPPARRRPTDRSPADPLTGHPPAR